MSILPILFSLDTSSSLLFFPLDDSISWGFQGYWRPVFPPALNPQLSLPPYVDLPLSPWAQAPVLRKGLGRKDLVEFLLWHPLLLRFPQNKI